MTVPLFIFLIIYLVLMGTCLLFSLWNIYHVIRFGTLNFHTVLTSFIFVTGIIIILFSAYQNLKGINWHQGITIFEGLGIELPGPESIKNLQFSPKL